MNYYEGLTEKEISYIKEAKKIGTEQGDCKELSDLSCRAYSEYKLGTVSLMLPVCKILKINFNELFTGEKLSEVAF